MRCGTFAEDDETRQSSGATYYGVMEMTGNLYEWAVGVGNASGRSFTGVHGNGTLDANGLPDAAGWPTFLGFRGGTYASTISADGRISDRNWANWNASSTTRYASTGGRGVRTAP